MTEQALHRPLPDNYTEIDRIVIYKALDEDGDVCILHSATPGLRTWEALGMLTFTSDCLRGALQAE